MLQFLIQLSKRMASAFCIQELIIRIGDEVLYAFVGRMTVLRPPHDIWLRSLCICEYRALKKKKKYNTEYLYLVCWCVIM